MQCQLWGEAVQSYQTGGRWWFDHDDPRDVALLALTEAEQARRVGGTLWSEAAAELADRLVGGLLVEDAGGVADSISWFSSPQVRGWMTAVTGVEINDGTWLKVVDGLKAAGWQSAKRTKAKTTHWQLSAERRESLTR